ncbi:MAG: dual specificity protein phosphatase [Anaerolineales bacterium]|nr:dual specificity protein phosphatase [Anaerolineales bacterium]
MDLSQITDQLFIGATPSVGDYARLRDLGVRLVINMRIEKHPAADLHKPPLKFLWLPTIDSPVLVIPIQFLLRGTRAALETIQGGGKVYAHCAKGRHRGVAMGAAILIAQGYASDAAMQLIKMQRPSADPDIFYIRSRILRFARAWQASK